MSDDVVISPYQIYEARSWGADMVLLIAGAMNPRTLAARCDLTEKLGMTAVVRVRTTTEADRALEAGARVVSIDTTTADEDRFRLIAGDLPLDLVTIGEGAQDVGDVAAFERADANAVLIGRDFGTSDYRALVQKMVAVGEHPWSNRSL
jgi:indole-3-glycerol phosphate synthase